MKHVVNKPHFCGILDDYGITEKFQVEINRYHRGFSGPTREKGGIVITDRSFLEESSVILAKDDISLSTLSINKPRRDVKS